MQLKQKVMGQTCGGRCINEERVDVLHSICVINLGEKKKKQFQFPTDLHEHTGHHFYISPPPGQTHPFCRATDPVLTLHRSFPSASGKVGICVWAQGSESPLLPPSAPVSKTDRKLLTAELLPAGRIGSDCAQTKITVSDTTC